MAKTIKEITLSNGKKVISQENVIHDKIEISNFFEDETGVTESQIDYYKTIIQDSLYYSYLKNKYTENSFDKIIKDTYLKNYKQITGIILNASTKSIFLKKVPEGSTMFSGLNYHEAFNPFQLLNMQKIKDDLLNYLNENVCDVVNTQPDPYMHPLKMQLIKNNLKVSMKIHSIDILLRNTLLVSVFNPKSFTRIDNSVASYAFQTYIDKLKRIDINTYNRVLLRFSNDLHKQLENGKTFRDPITTKKVEFQFPLPNLSSSTPPVVTTSPSTDEPEINEAGVLQRPVTISITSEAIENAKKRQKIAEENTLKFINILFNQEFIDVCNTFYDFFSKSVTESSNSMLGNTEKIKLSDLYEPLSYVFDNLIVYDKTEDVKDLCLLFGEDLNNGNFTLSLVTSVSLPERTSTGELFRTTDTTPFSSTSGEPPISRDEATAATAIKYFKLFSVETPIVPEYRSLSSEEKERVKRENLDTLKRTMRTDARLSSIFNYVLPTTKILNIASLYTISVMTKNYEKIAIAFDQPIKVSLDADKVLNNSCDLFELDFGFNAELAKQLLYLPIEILKALAETYDPNIFISNIIRNAAEAAGVPPLSIVPYSTPFWYYGLPPTNPIGWAYWGIDIGETAVYYLKNGLPGFEFVAQDMDLDFKNPFDQSKCENE